MSYENSRYIQRIPRLAAAAAIIAFAAKKTENEVKLLPDNNPSKESVITTEARDSGYTYPQVSASLTKPNHAVEHHLSPAQLAAKIITPYLRYEFNKIHFCEGNPWDDTTGNYHGGLGETNVNYAFVNKYYHLHYPANAGDATPAEQINNDWLLLKYYGVTNLPDQNGCTGSY